MPTKKRKAKEISTKAEEKESTTARGRKIKKVKYEEQKYLDESESDE